MRTITSLIAVWCVLVWTFISLPTLADDQKDHFAAGDLLELKIADLSAPNATDTILLRVDEEGCVNPPVVGAVKVGSADLKQSAAAIDQAYADAGLGWHANTSVRRVETAAEAKIKLGPIAPGELINIRLVDVEGPQVVTVKDHRVADDGSVELPYVGKLKLADKSERQAQAFIRQAFRDKGLIANLQVTVRRVEPAAAKK